MAMYGNPYDTGYRNTENFGNRNRYDTGYRGTSMHNENSGYYGANRGADNFGSYGANRGDWNAYDRGYRGQGGYTTGNEGYDRGYKSRWQTDYGDPFNDRGSHTPIRMIRGEYRGNDDRGRGGYDTGFRGGYDTGFRGGSDTGFRGGSDTGFRGGYDAGYRNNQRDFGSAGYDRDFYAGNPMSYEPYGNREGTRMRGNDRNFQNNRRGYDSGWY